MISYFDTSSLLKLLVREVGTEAVVALWNDSERLVSVSLVEVEARAAMAAATRSGRLSTAQHQAAKFGLDRLLSQLRLIEVTGELISAAADLAEQDRLRGYDAVHLAAALLLGTPVFSSADTALCAAASRHGLHVANPLIP